jgi:arginase
MSRPVRIIGIPLDLGQAHRGVDMGASAVRYAGLARELRKLGLTVTDAGDLPMPVRDSLPPQPEARIAAIRDVCEAAYLAARAAVENGDMPIFLGGDHSIAIGTIGGVSAGQDCGVLWIDAHGDFNIPETSPSDNIHGMALAVLCGEGPPELVSVGRPGPKLAPRDVVLIGLREADPGERNRLRQSGMTVFTMRDIDERGMGRVARDALERLEHRQRLHVSLDIDSLDPKEAPGAGTLVHGGLSYREAQLLMEIIADQGGADSLDIVEINPILDAANRTARLAVELASSLCGKRIL